jgi:hypothetical protein
MTNTFKWWNVDTLSTLNGSKVIRYMFAW